MEFKHIAIEEDGTVTVHWNMSMDDYKALVADAAAELEVTGEQKKIPELAPENWNESMYPVEGSTTGERGFQTRDRDRSGRDAIEDDLYVKGDK
jgi:hypothetical protein